MKLSNWFKPNYADLLLFLAGVITGMSVLADSFWKKLLYLAIALATAGYAFYVRTAQNKIEIKVGGD